ncbi:MAG: carbohydrate-binding protein [Bacteroidia bacterium]|nr:carbohydrate-binding protein [Bacteroidia bacterium]
MAASTFAANYYVDATNGNDGFSGTSLGQAFKTISRMDAQALQPGDNIYFLNGTYERSGQKLMIISESGTASNWITLQNYPGHSPILKFNSWTGIELVNGASYIAFKGLKIQGARTSVTLANALNQPGSCAQGQAGNAQGIYNGTGILAVGPNLSWSDPSTTGNEVPHHILVENCEVFDCTSAGIAFQQADYVTIRGCQVYNNCWYTIYGTSGINLYQLINTDGTTGIHNVISGNHVYSNQLLVPQIPVCQFYDGNGIIVDDFKHTQTFQYKNPSITFPSYTGKTLITNNVTADNGGSGLHFYLSDYCYVYNNTVVNNATQNGGGNGNGDFRIGTCDHFDIQNNVFIGTKVHHVTGTNTDITYANNYESGGNINATIGGASCPSCLSTGMTFDNMDNGSAEPYKTSANSSVIDQGVTIADVVDDYLGNARSEGLGYEMGAYEVAFTGACINNTDLPAKIEAESFSTMSGVSTETTSDIGGGQNVSFIDLGDYMEYLIEVAADTSFLVEFRIAGAGTGIKTIELFSDGTTLGTLEFAATNGWQTWTTVSKVIALTAGCHTLRVQANTSGFNFNWLNFSYYDPTACVGGTTLPALIEAEDYSSMLGVQNGSTTDVGGGSNVGFVDAGDYLNYKISVPTAGTYTLDLRVAAVGTSTKTIDIQSDGNTIQTVSFPATGGWQTWSTVSTTIPLNAGCQTLTLLMNSTGLNINWLDLDLVGVTFPVELVDFSAEVLGNIVQIDWITATEINNDYFVIERSSDAVIWSKQSRIEGAGNTRKETYYSDMDHSPLPGISFYRLAQYDIDGTVSYSETKSVRLESNLFSAILKAYPNPTTGLITVSGDEMAGVMVFDIVGREVSVLVTQKNRQETEVDLDLRTLEPGIYFIRSEHGSVMVQKQ